MINYKFYKNEIGIPHFFIKGELEGLSELGSCSYDYIEEIVTSLKKVISGELSQFDFGYEIYSIESQKENSQVVDAFNGWKCIAEIPTTEIYSLMKDWENYLNKNYSIQKNNESTCNNIKGASVHYTFFDGLKIHKVTNQYNNWLSSSDFSIWSNSYVETENKRIYIIKENVKALSTFTHFKKEELELLSNKYDLKIKDEKDIYYAYTDDYNSRQLEISENDELIVIYSIEGSRAPESIYIYGVFEKKTSGS